jgi:hypothetical protein
MRKQFILDFGYDKILRRPQIESIANLWIDDIHIYPPRRILCLFVRGDSIRRRCNRVIDKIKKTQH